VEKAQALIMEVKKLSEKGAICRATSDLGMGFISLIFFVVPKPGSLVPCYKPLNSFILQDGDNQISEGFYSRERLANETRFTLQFLYIQRTKSSYLKFYIVAGPTVAVQSAPFRLSSATCIFTKVLKPVVPGWWASFQGENMGDLGWLQTHNTTIKRHLRM